MLKNFYRVMGVKWASSTLQTDNGNTAVKQGRREEEVGVDESEICTTVRRSLYSLQKQVIVKNYFSK
jgi:hypothetical protein